MIKEFKRKCHLFVENPPPEDRLVEWLALMQHYGAPTRLLDWTYSFFIAVYFALENLKRGQEKCCVWAIDYEWLWANFRNYLKKRDFKFDVNGKECKFIDIFNDITDISLTEKAYQRILFDELKPDKHVFQMNPIRLNQRLVIQQGVFLYPTDVSESFLKNLLADLSQSDSEGKIKRYIIPYESKEKILRNLHRMNINRAGLFPGLDGFAKSLNPSLFYDQKELNEKYKNLLPRQDPRSSPDINGQLLYMSQDVRPTPRRASRIPDGTASKE